MLCDDEAQGGARGELALGLYPSARFGAEESYAIWLVDPYDFEIGGCDSWADGFDVMQVGQLSVATISSVATVTCRGENRASFDRVTASILRPRVGERVQAQGKLPWSAALGSMTAMRSRPEGAAGCWPLSGGSGNTATAKLPAKCRGPNHVRENKAVGRAFAVDPDPK